MEKRLLLTRSRHDIGNQYLYVFSQEIIDDAQELGWKTDLSEDQKNCKKEIESRLDKTKPFFVFFNGHGTPQSILGFKDEILVDRNSAAVLSQKNCFC